MLSLRAKSLDFRFTSLPKSRYRLLKEGVIGGGFQGKISECLAYLDGWEAYRAYALKTY